jgi:hypothetical protein
MTKPAQIGLDLSVHVRRQPPTKVRAKNRVVVVLVAEPWWILKELGHWTVNPPPAGETHPAGNLTPWPLHGFRPELRRRTTLLPASR